jgi:hypothetical protein
MAVTFSILCPTCGSETITETMEGTNLRYRLCTSCKWSQRIKDQPLPLPEKAATDKVGTGLVLIPWYSILRLGKIFVEGLRYGRDNWKRGVHDIEYQEERFEHAMLHLIKWREGDRTEDHLAKVMWFCTTQMELERLETTPMTITSA